MLKRRAPLPKKRRRLDTNRVRQRTAPGQSHASEKRHRAVSQNIAMPQQASTEETRMYWQMRWFLAIVIAVWILTAIAATIVVFYLTRSPYSLSLFGTLTPPVYILYRVSKYLFPMGKRDFQLAALKYICKTPHISQSRYLKGYVLRSKT